MKLSNIATIQKEALSRAGDLPAWLDIFLQPLNSFIQQVGKALQGNLTFKDNMSCTITTQSMTHGVELQINPNSTLKVSGVLVTDASGQVVDKFGWSRKTNGKIGVTIYFDGGSSSTKADCTFIFLLG